MVFDQASLFEGLVVGIAVALSFTIAHIILFALNCKERS